MSKTERNKPHTAFCSIACISKHYDFNTPMFFLMVDKQNCGMHYLLFIYAGCNVRCCFTNISVWWEFEWEGESVCIEKHIHVIVRLSYIFAWYMSLHKIPSIDHSSRLKWAGSNPYDCLRLSLQWSVKFDVSQGQLTISKAVGDWYIMQIDIMSMTFWHRL